MSRQYVLGVLVGVWACCVPLLAQSPCDGLREPCVTLEWDPNSEPDLAGYNLYRSTQSGSGYTKINQELIVSTRYPDAAIVYGQTYYWVCTAVNEDGLESGYSNQAGPYRPNRTPVARDDPISGSIVVAPGTAVVPVDVLRNDSDPDGDPLTIVSVSSPAHGTAEIGDGQIVIYSPVPGYSGPDAFDYTINDGWNGTATAGVSISILQPDDPPPANDPPEAQDDQVQIAEDHSVTVEVLVNDSDPDSDDLFLSRVIEPPAHGRARLLYPGRVRYEPDRNFHGNDSFGYEVSDGRGGTASASVRVKITPVNDDPIAVDDEANTAPGQRVTIHVLRNDFDVDDDPLIVEWVSQPPSGRVAIDQPGQTSLTYTPDVGFEGTDSFEYRASDGTRSRLARVEVYVRVPQGLSSLLFPATINTGDSPFTEDTFVSIGLLNPSIEAEQAVTVKGRTELGVEVLSSQRVLAQLGQDAFTTGEIAGSGPDLATLELSGPPGLPLQGFFMVGDHRLSRMDGVGVNAKLAKRFYFPGVSEGPGVATLLLLINPPLNDPSLEADASLTLELRAADGTLLERLGDRGQPPVFIARRGSFVGTIGEIFGVSGIEDGFVEVRSNNNVPVIGYQVMAGASTLSSGAGRVAGAAGRHFASNFFHQEGVLTTVLKVLNPGTSEVSGQVRIQTDSEGSVGSRVLTRQVVFPAGRLTTLTSSEILGRTSIPACPGAADCQTKGSLELDLVGGIGSQLLATVGYLGPSGRTATFVPMVSTGLEETVFPQVAQTGDGSIFTGLAVLNPSADESVRVTVEAYSAAGEPTATQTFELGPKARRVGLLNGADYFGSGFEQQGGHLRVRAVPLEVDPEAGPRPARVISSAFFGDASLEFLSFIEGQEAR